MYVDHGVCTAWLVKVILTVVKQLKQLQIKPRKIIWGFNGVQTHDLRDTGAMLYELSYIMKPRW